MNHDAALLAREFDPGSVVKVPGMVVVDSGSVDLASDHGQRATIGGRAQTVGRMPDGGPLSAILFAFLGHGGGRAGRLAAGRRRAAPLL